MSIEFYKKWISKWRKIASNRSLNCDQLGFNKALNNILNLTIEYKKYNKALSNKTPLYE